jgi:uncharacterized protein YggE
LRAIGKILDKKGLAMNRPLMVVLASGLVVAGAVMAGEEKPVRSIAVTGTVETTAAPDLVVWTISLSDEDKNIREAKKRSDQKVQSVIALRDRLGIADGDLETGYVSVQREYESNPPQKFKGYVVTRSVTIRQRDLKRFDEYLDTFISSADMEVSFRFESSRMQDVRAETRLKAVQAAKDKAEAMALAVGAMVGRALTINDHAPGQEWWSGGLATSNVIAPGSGPPTDVASDKFVPGPSRCGSACG